jgi:hypothetical protein
LVSYFFVYICTIIIKINNYGCRNQKKWKGLYQLKSISDESYHPEKKWISEEEKKILITNEIWSFIEKLLKLIIVFLVIIGLMIYMIIKNNTKKRTLTMA